MHTACVCEGDPGKEDGREQPRKVGVWHGCKETSFSRIDRGRNRISEEVLADREGDFCHATKSVRRGRLAPQLLTSALFATLTMSSAAFSASWSASPADLGSGCKSYLQRFRFRILSVSRKTGKTFLRQILESTVSK